MNLVETRYKEASMFSPNLETLDPIRRAPRWLVLIALLSTPLACDLPTVPKPRSRTRIETSLLLASQAPGPAFDNSQYFSIDMNRAAAVQYCTATYVNHAFGIPIFSGSFLIPGCSAVQIGSGLYGWAAQTPNSTALLPIDLKQAVADQYGAGYVLGAVGVGAYDWRAVHWSALSNAVLPVMVVGQDYFNDVGAVAGALQNFKSVISSTWNWYATAMASQGDPRETFRPLQPLVVFNQSSYGAAQWNTWSTSQPATFLDYAWLAYASAYPTATLGASGADLRVLISVFTGPFTGGNITVFGGAGVLNTMFGSSVIPAFAVVPPATSGLSCTADGNGYSPSPLCNQSTYWIGHELGRTWGLDECTASSSVECQYTIMEVYPTGEVPNVPTPNLMRNQITTLANSGFFSAP